MSDECKSIAHALPPRFFLSPQSRIRTGKYRDALDVDATNDPAHEHMMERLSINVVPIPGESSWVEQAWRKMEAQSGHTVVQPADATANAKKTAAPAAASAGSAKKKRGLDGGEAETMDDHSAAAAAPAAASSSAASELSMGDDPALAANGTSSSSSSSAAPAAAAAADSDSTPVKKGKSESGVASTAAPGQAVSPRLSDHGLEVIVTVYDGLAKSQAAPAASSSSSAVAARAPLRVGDMYEFIGVLSLTPDLKVHLEDVDLSMDGMGAELWSQRRSQALRMHALAAVKIEPGFPFIADPTADAALFATQRQELLPVLPNLRAALVGLLTAVLGGDALAGETLLLFLLQRLHSRGSAVGGRIGKLVLNLVAPAATASNPVGPSQLVQRLTSMLQNLLPRVTQLEINIGALNSQVWQPKKNYEDESLDSNLLHLASPSCLVLDETRLAAGTLSAVGLTNLRVVSKLLSQSQLEYDFQYQSLDFPVEYSGLIVSAGAKSLVHQDGQAGIDVTLRVQASAAALYDQPPAMPAVTAQEWDFFRAYLLMCRSASFDINDALSSSIENHFVALRQLRPSVTNEATLHLLLNLARLYCLSHGESELASNARWNEITHMFEQLHQRAH